MAARVAVGTAARDGDAAVEGNAPHARSYLIGVVALVGTLAVVAVLLMTRRGPGLISDSDIYVGTARNLAAGRGLTTPFNLLVDPYSPAKAAAFDGAIPLTHYPPLFPAVLAVFQWAGIDAIDASRWLNALLLGVNAVLAGFAALRFSRGSYVAAVTTAVVTAFSFNILFLHGYVVTEPLMLAFCLGGLILLDRLLSTPSRGLLVALSLCCACAGLVRYAGVALTLTAVLAVLLGPPLAIGSAGERHNRRTARGRRARYALVLAVAGFGPLLAWIARLSLDGSSSGARPIAFHPPGSVDAETIFRTVSAWFIAADSDDLARALVLIGVAMVVVVAAVLDHRDRAEAGDPHATDHAAASSPRLWILLIFVIAYALVLLASKTVADATIPFDDRILGPIQVVVTVMVVSLVARVMSSRLPRVAVVVCIGVAALLWVWPWRVGVPSYVALDTFDVVDQGVPVAVAGPVERAAARLPRDTLIVSNSPDRLYIVVGRPSIFPPARKYSISDERNPDFEHELDELRRVLAQHDGRIVYFDGDDSGINIPTIDELRRRIPLVLVAQYANGSIWRLSERTS